jgi:hypothetical protein
MFKTSLELSTESERKQLDVSESVYEYVKQKVNEYNKTCTKGILIYEIYLMVENGRTENFDVIDEFESRIDEDLVSLVSPTFLRDLEKIKIISDRRDRIDTSTDSAEYKMSIHIPSRFDNEILPDWGANNSVMEKVTEYKLCAYTCRNHRLTVKRDIIEYIQDDESPNTNLAEAIINNDSMEMFDVGDIDDAHSKLDGGLNWYSRSDLTFDDIEEKQKHDETRLSNKQKDERAKAIKNAISNEYVTREETRQRVGQIFNIKSSKTLNNYMSKIDTLEVKFADKDYKEYDLVGDYNIIFGKNIRSEKDIDKLDFGVIPRVSEDISKDKQAYLIERILNFALDNYRNSSNIVRYKITDIDKYGYKLNLDNCAKMFSVAGLIDENDKKEFIDYMKEINQEYNIDGIDVVSRKIKLADPR